MKKTVFVLFLLFLSLSATTRTIRIAAAANLRLALDEIRNAYREKNPGVTINVNYGATGMLFQQIVNGADFNLFMAADNDFPEKLKKMKLIEGETAVYAYGRLVLWSNSQDVSKGPELLTNPWVKRIAVAKPELAPYGDRAIEFLKKTGLFNQVKDKLVYADNVSQAAQFVQTGNAQAGFLAYSLTFTPEMKGSVFIIDPGQYSSIEQAMAIIKGKTKNEEAVKFMNFVRSKECKPIFEKFGYWVP